LTILDAINGPNLFGTTFSDAGTWTAWRTFLALEAEVARYDRKLWIVEPVTPAAYPRA
jgi:hypothetical protein